MQYVAESVAGEGYEQHDFIRPAKSMFQHEAMTCNEHNDSFMIKTLIILLLWVPLVLRESGGVRRGVKEVKVTIDLRRVS